MATDYETQRLKNIAANLAILASLGLEKPSAQKPSQQQQKAKAKAPKPASDGVKREGGASRKRKALTVEDEKDGGSVIEGGRRKSARIVRAAAKQLKGEAELNSGSDFESLDYDDLSESEKRVKRNAPRKYKAPINKVFGHIDGVEVGSWWEMRSEAAAAGVHAPWVAGISGCSEGAWSVAISGGYEDDIDEGFRFTFTGEGGRDLRTKNLRTGPQSKGQVLTKGNLALKRSCETGNPVRVLRGFKGDPKWAPKSGYRYDGLYQVMKWWEDTGLSGYMVYKFAFKRLDGQPPIDLTAGPAYEEDFEEADENAEVQPQSEYREEGENVINENAVGENAMGRKSPEEASSVTTTKKRVRSRK